MFCRSTCTFVLFTCLSSFCWATGNIVGTLTDPSGAAVQGATVIVSNRATKTVRRVESNAVGDFTVSVLPPGQYQVSILKPGFRKMVYSNLSLDVDQTLRVDAVLQLGEMTTQVEVNSTPSLLETDSSSLGQVMDQQRVKDLPLNQRQFLALTLLVPGAGTPAYGSFNLGQGGAIHVDGSREQTNAFLLDGVDNNKPRISQYTVPPSIEAIAEFKVQSGNASAEFGRSTGGQIDVVLKSGTNNWHGSAFEFLRNRHLDAKNFSDLPDCQSQSVRGTCAQIPRLDRSQFGGSLGGPIVRDRTFVFTTYEGLRLRQATTRNVTVPSQLERQAALEAVPPAERSAAGLAVLNLYPLANAGTDLQRSNTYIASPLSHDTIDQGLVKLDHHLGVRDTLSGRYAIFDQDRFNAYDSALSFTALPEFGTFGLRRGQSVGVTWLRVAESRIVNEFRFGFNRLRTGVIQENVGQNQNQRLGFPTISSDPRFWGYPQVNVAGFDSIGEAGNTPQEWLANTFQFSDNLAWVPELQGGRHQLKAGFDVRLVSQERVAPLLARGRWSFTGSLSGDSLQDLIRGTPASALAGRGDTTQKLRQTGLGFYLQDALHVNPRLSVQLGLRYEYTSPPSSQLGPFYVPDLTQHSLTCTPKPDCQFLTAPSAGFPDGTFSRDLNNLAPRVGFAWRPLATERLVVRSAYGIFYDAGVLAISNLYSLNPPGFVLQAYPNSGSDTIQSIVNHAGISLGALAFQIDPNRRDAYVQQWHLDLQYEVRPGLLADLGYVGTKGTGLTGGRDLNQAEAGKANPRPYPQFGPILAVESRASSSYNALQARLEKRSTRGQTWLAAYTWSKSIDNASSPVGSAQGESLVPQDSNDLRGERSLSTFHASHRFVLSFLQSLPSSQRLAQLSHSWLTGYLLGDWQAGLIASFQSGHPFTVFRSIDQSGTGFGPAGDLRDRPDLITDPGKPGPVPTNPDPACQQTFSRGGKAADVVDDPASWFNPCAFAAPGTMRFGTEGRNSVIGPGLANIDFSLSKLVPLGREGHHLQLRFEFFNLFNHPIFDLPEIFFDSTRFAAVSSSNAFETSPPRQIQLAVKYVF
jgi:hypothetical protein